MHLLCAWILFAFRAVDVLARMTQNVIVLLWIERVNIVFYSTLITIKTFSVHVTYTQFENTRFFTKMPGSLSESLTDDPLVIAGPKYKNVNHPSNCIIAFIYSKSSIGFLCLIGCLTTISTYLFTTQVCFQQENSFYTFFRLPSPTFYACSMITCPSTEICTCTPSRQDM